MIIKEKDGTTKKVTVKRTVKIEVIDGKNKTKRSVKKEAEDKVRLYPNPSSGKFTVEFTVNANEPTFLSVSDLNGKELIRKEFKEAGQVSEPVDLSGYAKGTYLVKIHQGKKNLTKKIVIE